MNCLFCQRFLDDPIRDYLCMEGKETAVAAYKCYSCAAEFHVIDFTERCFEYSLKHNQYMFYFMLDEGRFELVNSVYHVSNGGYTVYNTILKWEFVPKNITPTNIEDKLKTLLTFL